MSMDRSGTAANPGVVRNTAKGVGTPLLPYDVKLTTGEKMKKAGWNSVTKWDFRISVTFK